MRPPRNWLKNCEMASGRDDARTYEVVRMFTLDGVQSRFDRKDCFEPAEFWSDDEQPDPTRFVVCLRFGNRGDTNGHDDWISCVVKPTNRSVKASNVRFIMLDIDLKVAAAQRDFDQDLTPERHSPKFYNKYSSQTGDTLYLQCKITFVRRLDASSAMIADRDAGLHDDLVRLFELSEDTDFTIIVGDEKFRAHKVILMARSEYFRSLFRSGMKESVSNVVTLDDVDPRVFKELLRSLYCGLPPENLSEIALSLLPLADRFGLLGLRSACVSAIGGALDKNNVVRF